MNLKKRGLCLLLALLLGFVFTAQAAGICAGTESKDVKRSKVRYFIRTDHETVFHKGETTGTGRLYTVPADGMYMLLSNQYYLAGDGCSYYVLYYKGTLVRVACSEVTLLRDAQVEEWIRENIWAAEKLTAMLRSDELQNDINVYALQYALKILGYYTQKLDGGYGENTVEAVKAFQRDFNLSADGDAGKATLPLLYTAALNVGPGWYSSESGTLMTITRASMRKSPSRSAGQLCKLQANQHLKYTKKAVTGQTVWYYVISNEASGWIMADYVVVE